MTRIECHRVSKQFLRGTIPQVFLGAARGRLNEFRFWALQNVDLSLVGDGKRFGLIGANGSGKTTLLRIIAGVTTPTYGSVTVCGRVVSLLELFAGMQTELTGRENIYFHGMILGMQRREIQKKLDAIVAFAGVDEFLDMPLKHYSLGMTMRLGFSVATHIDANIILVDEAWGVGDAEFQNKSFERLHAIQRNGTTLIIVSHHVDVLERLTDEVMWLEHGKLVQQGPTKSVMNRYLERSLSGISP